MPHLLVPPRIYGWQHIIYLIIFIIISVGTLALIKLKVRREKTVDIIVKSVGGALLAIIIANRISLIRFYDSVWALVPNTVCGTTSLLFGLWTVFGKRDSLPFHFLVYIAFWGGLIASVYPTFIGQNEYFTYFPTLTGLMHHSISLYLSVLLVMTGYVKPKLNKFYAFPVGFCFLMVYGIFLLDALGDKIPDGAMYIFSPLVPGTFLTWYVVGPALILGSLGLLCLWEKVLYPKILNKKSQRIIQAAD